MFGFFSVFGSIMFCFGFFFVFYLRFRFFCGAFLRLMLLFLCRLFLLVAGLFFGLLDSIISSRRILLFASGLVFFGVDTE